MRARSSLFSSTSSRNLRASSTLLYTGVFLHSFCADTASATAWSMSSLDAAGTVSTRVPSYGFVTSITSPLDESANLSPIIIFMYLKPPIIFLIGFLNATVVF